ncbi:MAG: hypothetical protein Q7W16_01590 [Coriobacteriia bacterium]|nr:hypothetical protein [Coriobacteriia bacterium]
MNDDQVKRTLPPWAWIATGLLAVALVVGAVAFAYISGLSAGRDTNASGETTRTASGETSDSPDASVAVLPADEPPAEEPVADVPAVEAAKDPPPSSTPTKTLTPLQPKIPKISKLYTVPTTWKVVFKHSNTGPWEMPNPPGLPLDAGYLRMTVLATDNANNSGYVQLKRVDGGASLPNYGILYSWSAGVGNVVYKVTDPVLIEAGTYQLRASIQGPWTIVLEK